MALLANCLGPPPVSGGLGVDNGDCTFDGNSGSDFVTIGGRLSVGANQLPGLYTGVITVTAYGKISADPGAFTSLGLCSRLSNPTLWCAHHQI
jgi:hypothetical protein